MISDNQILFDLLERMQGILREQREALLGMDTETLLACAQSSAECQQEIRRLLRHGRSTPVMEKLDPLRQSIEALRQFQEANRLLAQQGLGMLRKLRSVLLPASEENGAYDRKGQVASPRQACLVNEST